MAKAVDGGEPPARDDWKNEQDDDAAGGAKDFEKNLGAAGGQDPAKGEDPDWKPADAPPPAATADGSERGDRPGGGKPDRHDRDRDEGGHPGRDDATLPVTVAAPPADNDPPPPPPPTYTLTVPTEPPIRATTPMGGTTELAQQPGWGGGGGGGGGWGGCEPVLGQPSQGAQTRRDGCDVVVPDPPMPGTPANAHPTLLPSPPPGSWLEPYYLDADVRPYNYGPAARYNLGLPVDPSLPVPGGVTVDDPGVRGYVNAGGRVVVPMTVGGPGAVFNSMVGLSWGGSGLLADAGADLLPGGPRDLGYQGPGKFAGMTVGGDYAKYYMAPGYRTYEPGKVNENILPGGYVVKDYIGIDLFDGKAGGISSNFGPLAPPGTTFFEGSGVLADHGRVPPSTTNWGLRLPLNEYLKLARIPIDDKLLALDVKVTPEPFVQLSDGREAQHLRIEVGAKPGATSWEMPAEAIAGDEGKVVIAHALTTMTGMPLATAQLMAERAIDNAKLEFSLKGVVQYDIVIEQSNNLELGGAAVWTQPNVEIFTTVRGQAEAAVKWNPPFPGWDRIKKLAGDAFKQGARLEIAFTTSTRFESPQAVYVPVHEVFLPLVANGPAEHEVFLPLVQNGPAEHEVFLPLVANDAPPAADPPPPPEPPARLPGCAGEFDPESEQVHTVRTGETVRSIAEEYLQTALGRAPSDIELLEFSHQLIDRNMPEERNPDLIVPGELLVIPAPPPLPTPLS